MKEYSELQVDAMIKLRYGSLVTDPDHPSFASFKLLGQLFKCSGALVRQLLFARFEKLRRQNLPLIEKLRQSSSERPRQTFGLRFLKQHEIEWLTSELTLRRQAGLSLDDRCKHFKKEFPRSSMNRVLLRRVYTEHKIKKKRFRWRKEPKGKSQLESKRDLATMKRMLTIARNDGRRILYLDECMFTRATLRAEEWCRLKANFNVDVDSLKEPTLALLSAISKERGLEHFKVFEKSVNVAKFKTFLQELREKNGDDKLCVFMDNLSAHTSKKTLAEMKRLDIRHVFNVPYSPQYNPIELSFAKVKQRFKTLRLQKLLGQRQDDHHALVVKAQQCLTK